MKAIVLSTFGLLMLASVCTAQSSLAKANPAKRSIKTTKTEVSRPNYPIIQATPAADLKKQEKGLLQRFKEKHPKTIFISRADYNKLSRERKAYLDERSVLIHEGAKPSSYELQKFK